MSSGRGCNENGKAKASEESEKQREEKENREKRRNNVIVFNLMEPTKEREKDRELEDQNCDQVFGETLNTEECQIGMEFRLGKNLNGKVRPTLVKLEDELSKWQNVSRAMNLK